MKMSRRPRGDDRLRVGGIAVVVVVLIAQLGVNATNGSTTWHSSETLVLVFALGSAALVAMACAGRPRRARLFSHVRHRIRDEQRTERRRTIRTRISLN